MECGDLANAELFQMYMQTMKTPLECLSGFKQNFM